MQIFEENFGGRKVLFVCLFVLGGEAAGRCWRGGGSKFMFVLGGEVAGRCWRGGGSKLVDAFSPASNKGLHQG